MHRARPEWGVGSVTEARKSVQDGVQCQRLTVRFEHGGLKTVSTAFAELRRIEGAMGTSTPPPASGPRNGPDSPRLPVAVEAEDADLAEVRERLGTLPDEATDPFRALASRIRATVELYRYSDQGAPLLAWATAVTGLPDPLSKVSRHELEQAFARFEVLRDRHLAQLMQSAAREGIDAPALIRAMPAEAQRALQRNNRRR